MKRRDLLSFSASGLTTAALSGLASPGRHYYGPAKRAIHITNQTLNESCPNLPGHDH